MQNFPVLRVCSASTYRNMKTFLIWPWNRLLITLLYDKFLIYCMCHFIDVKLMTHNDLWSVWTRVRRVSNIPYLSKVIERHAVDNVSRYLTANGLGEPLQSAYKPVHGTETTLLKFKSDIMESVSHRKGIFLALLYRFKCGL